MHYQLKSPKFLAKFKQFTEVLHFSLMALKNSDKIQRISIYLLGKHL